MKLAKFGILLLRRVCEKLYSVVPLGTENMRCCINGDEQSFNLFNTAAFLHFHFKTILSERHNMRSNKWD